MRDEKTAQARARSGARFRHMVGRNTVVKNFGISLKNEVMAEEGGKIGQQNVPLSVTSVKSRVEIITVDLLTYRYNTSAEKVSITSTRWRGSEKSKTRESL